MLKPYWTIIESEIDHSMIRWFDDDDIDNDDGDDDDVDSQSSNFEINFSLMKQNSISLKDTMTKMEMDHKFWAPSEIRKTFRQCCN